MLGEVEAAHDQLEAALSVSLAAAKAGNTSDDYTDLGGVLGDLAANHIKRPMHS